MKEQDLKNSDVYQSKFGKKDRWSFLYVLLAVILFALLGTRIYLAKNYFVVDVVGNSMYPTLQDKDVLLVRYGNDAKRGDIIIVDVTPYKTDPEKMQAVAHPFKDDTKYLIKRLIAIEGDTVRCKNGILQIRYAGKEYGENEWDYHPSDDYIKDGKNADFPVYEIGEGEVFFLGDNRLDSSDSRYKNPQRPSEVLDTAHLKQLYKKEDICGVVPQWAYENRDWLQYMPGVYNPKR